MASPAEDGMIAQLLAAGRSALSAHLEQNADEEQEALEFMDSLWDRMPPDARDRALEKLHSEGMDGFAERIEEERRDLTGGKA